MTDSPRVRVVLCWHMHQPQYRDLVTGEHLLPWTYLHGIKDYVDMAQHLEAVPGAAAVVNFSPILLEQLDEYSAQLGAYLRGEAALRDPVLALLSPAGIPADRALWPALMRACLRANRERLIERFPPYLEIAQLAEQLLQSAQANYASEQFLLDLAVWYHIAWLGETVRRGDPRVQELQTKARNFSTDDSRELLTVIADVLVGLVPRYRRLMGSGQVELAVSPWGHPILPLMLDFKSAREALPAIALPSEPEYPGGEDRARWHVARAIQVFSRAFGVRPRGCWPSEGAVSTATLELLESFEFDWAASGETVLRNSLAQSSTATPTAQQLNRPWRLAERQLPCFFRADGLSDLIGFTYATWHGDDAAKHFVQQLERVADEMGSETDQVISIVLDGENAWEYYPFNGYYFLRALYQQLAAHPRLKLTTYAQALAEGVTPAPLPTLVAGSWVHGTLATWMGDPGKNAAWDLLCQAKHMFDQVMVEGGLDDAEQLLAERQLGVCEGSDWAWWFGDYNPAESVLAFDALYRRHLTNLYRILEEQIPDTLQRTISAGGGGEAEHGGVMRRGYAAGP